MTATKTEYTILPLKNEHVNSATELFTQSFCDSEPVTKHLGIKYDEYRPFVREVLQKAAKDGLSVVAVDKQNHVIACTIAEDITNLFKPDLSHYPKMKPIIALIDELSRPFLKNKKFKKNKIAHVWIAIVDEKYRGQGLSTAIDMACGDLDVRKGFDFVYAEFTNNVSEKITHHYKVYELCNSIKFNEFKLDGQTPFKGVKGEATAYVVGIRPGIEIDSLADCYTIDKSYTSI